MRPVALAAVLAAACSRDLSLPPTPVTSAGGVFGRAVYSAPGSSALKPAAGTLITLSSSSLSTLAAADGTFDLEGISSAGGQLLFQFDSDGDGRFDRQRSLGLQEIGAKPGRQVGLGDVVVGQSAGLHGTVLRSELQGLSSGHAGTLVFVPLTAFSAYSASDGRYALEGLPAGPLELGFFRAGYLPAQLTDLQLSPAEDLAVGQVVLAPDDGAHPGALSGTVTTQPAAASAAGTTVAVTDVTTGTESRTQTGADGTFAFAALSAGLYDVRAARDGYSPALAPNVLVFPGQTTALALGLGQGATFDGGRPAPPDAGPVVACVLTRDCGPGQWCDANLCAPLCGATVACNGARVCDPATRTCVQPCGAGCPNGQSCDAVARVCRTVCDGSLPCPPGLACAANVCVPQCSVPADCASVHQTCQAGQCVPDGTCGNDLDCLASQLCIGTSCVQRVAPDAGTDAGWPCARACDCRLGERCADGACVADLVPTVLLGADGGSLAAALAAAHPGDVVALRADDLFWADDGFALSTPALTVSGGYVFCGTNRWVYDGQSRTTLASDGGTVLRVPGTIAVPLPDVTLRGLSLRAGANPSCAATDVLSASSAARLKLVAINGNAFGATCGAVILVHVRDSDEVDLDGVSVTPAVMPADSRGVWLERSSGTVSGFMSPVLAIPNGHRAISVQAPTGPISILGASIDRSGGTQSLGIFAETCGSNRLEISGGRFVPTIGRVIDVEGCANVDVHDNLFDGAPQSTFGGYGFFFAANSAGSFSRNRSRLLANPGGTNLVELQGSGAWTLDDDTFEGCGAGRISSLFYLVGTTGPISIARATIGLPDSGTAGVYCATRGLDLIAAANTSLVDSYLRVLEPISTNAGTVRIERSVLIGDRPLTAGNAQVETYSSFYASTAGPAWDVVAGQLYAVGNTVDGAATAGTVTSFGFRCSYGTVAFLSSNLINGGLGASHLMLADGNLAGVCFDPASYDHNWFYASGGARSPSGEQVALVTSSVDGGADARGNIVGETVGCYPTGSSPQSWVLPAQSPCIDRGASGVRRDTSPIDRDVEGRMRRQGAAPDIGAYERQ